MDNKIVAMPGAIRVGTGDVCSSVVELLERKLEEARRGELSAVAIAFIDGSGTPGMNWECGTTGSSRLAGIVSHMAWAYHKDWDDA
jgi:hypothetical protein